MATPASYRINWLERQLEETGAAVTAAEARGDKPLIQRAFADHFRVFFQLAELQRPAWFEQCKREDPGWDWRRAGMFRAAARRSPRLRRPRVLPPATVPRRAAPRRRRCSPRPAVAARASPPAEPDPTGALERFQKTRAWQLLQPADRRLVIKYLRSGSPAAAALIEDVFTASALARNEHPGAGEVWLGPQFPINGMLIRDRRDGVWRILQFDSDSTAHESWNCWGGRA
jgi:hypothetical protein